MSEQQPQEPETVSGQPCTFCNTNNLTLMQHKVEVPYFGNVLVFSMTCSECKYHKSDVEALEHKEPAKYTLEITTQEDLKIRVVRSSEAEIKIPHMITITPGEGANGYVTNVEGILNRVKHVIEQTRESEEDEEAKDKAKNMLKKLQKVIWGQEKLTMILEDPTGNSAIVSEKAVIVKMKGKKENKTEE
ncbi:TPA: ZPR1 zinc finger domain-containing protein [Candidatus Woesearchaeota archaeon]|nr:MAG: zinc finger protein [archaeon GW2011_AR16]HIG96183.1 ZPR1 zinc finger domain-containing protein [Candidatus Woesearchaeota archaeon]